MIPIGLEELARVVSGRIVGLSGSVEARGVTVDSREAGRGDLFVALQGEYFDGHDFVDDAFQRGAGAALVSREVSSRGPLVMVADPQTALENLGGYVRDVVDPIVVGVTGSTGKTTTRDLIASVASSKFRTVASKKNFNNEIGVPLTLASLERDTEVLVCEMGSRGAGDIRLLCEIARPQVGVVTNVGVTHFEQFGSKDAIASAKAEMIEALPEGGTAVLNADDFRVRAMPVPAGVSTITFGSDRSASLCAEKVRLDRLGRAVFRITTGSEGVWVELRLVGRRNAGNAAAAAAVGMALGLTLDQCKVGLESAKPAPWRMETTESEGVIYVNDAYNSNPDSVAAALETCAAMAGHKQRFVVVLGEMAELGAISEAEHRQVGALAAATAGRLIVVGDAAMPIAQGAKAAGLLDVVQTQDASGVAAVLGERSPGDVVLVKGSRVAGLENVVDEILGTSR